MKILERAFDKIAGMWAGASLGGQQLRLGLIQSEYTRESDRETATDKAVREGLAEIELAIDDIGWQQVSATSGVWNFSRSALRRMISLSRLMYICNPLIKRVVTVQELYVWGSGCTIKADSDIVNEVLSDFYEDPKNQCVIGHNWDEREREQRIEGNTFLALFRNKKNGAVRIRLIPVDQIEEVILNPEDSKEPWFYRRSYVNAIDPLTNLPTPKNQETVLYPDIDYQPYRERQADVASIKVDWDCCVMHIKTGGLSVMTFGVPELFSALNWAVAYKRILENFATILNAYARVAMKITGNQGAKGVAASKTKMQTGLNSAGGVDTNPSTNTASWFLASGGVDIAAVKTAHSTTGPDEARALRSMVAAGGDTPEHFFGDADIGNLATSSTLDRPTELKMVSRQQFWANIIEKINKKLIEWSARAPQGKLKEAGFTTADTKDPFDGTRLVTVTPPKDQTLTVTIKFPPIIDKEIVERVRAVVQATTLGGSPAEGIIPDRKLVCKLLFEALGRKDAEKLADEMYPAPVLQGFKDPAKVLDNETKTADAKVKAANNPIKLSGQAPSASAK